ncbi:variable surface protein [Plasmodium gonderi]|uniref:Variable surface protein n=1 Tax=Plasmodium gonderi TaxID=77519 RepID=A0A1Y1JVU3_PLAGO|nr:variable surface protein [Plasmodium gonderi]GAW84004.1 variable surface protein [Plasmodium gonderi]
MTIPTQDDILKVDFDDVYMKSNENYNWIIRRNWNEPKHHHFTELCSYAKYDICRLSHGSHFTVDCRRLSILLDNMKLLLNRNHHNKIYFCIYFGYKMHELLKKYNCTIKSPTVAYDYMMKAYKYRFNTIIPKICKDYFVDLSHETYENFKKLDELYNRFYLFKNSNHSCSHAEYCSTEYKKLLRTISSEQNMDFHDLLYEFIYHYEKYMQKLNVCKSTPQTLPPLPEQDRSRVISTEPMTVNVIRDKISKIEVSGINEMEGTGENMLKMISERKKTLDKARLSPHTGTETTLSSGMIVLFFSVLIILFILYKYTTFGSYFNPRMRKIKRKIKKRNKENINNMDSYKLAYNNPNDNCYHIEYSYMDDSL